MNVFKTPTTLNDGQQQPVNNFAPRANLKCFFKDGAISSGTSEVKEASRSVFLLRRSTCLSISDISGVARPSFLGRAKRTPVPKVFFLERIIFGDLPPAVAKTISVCVPF
jgi:hypothetical protein